MSFFDRGMGESKRKWYPFVGALVGTACVLSMIWSVFFPLLQAQFGMDTVAPFAIGASCVGGCNMILAPLIGGPLLDAKGPKLTFGLAIIVFLLAIVCMYQLEGLTDWSVGQVWWIIGSCAVGLGIGLYSATMSATCSKWNPDNVGWAVGIDNIGPALAPLWAAPVASFLVPTLGIGNGFAVMLGIGALGIFFFGFLPFRSPEPGWKPKDPVVNKKGEVQKSLAEEANEKEMTMAEIFKSPKLWVMALIVCLACIAYMMFTMNLSTLFIEGQIGFMEKAGVMALLATAMSAGSIANCIARPVWGWIMDKLKSPWKTLIVMYAFFIVALIFFTVVYKSTGFAIVIATVLVYFMGGGTAPVHMSTAPALFGTKNAGKTITVTLVATGVAWVIAPVTGALIKDATGSYLGALVVMMVCLAINIVIVAILLNKEKKGQAAKNVA